MAHVAMDNSPESWSGSFDQLACGAVITAFDRRICYVNPAFCSMCGYERDELLGNTPRVLQSGQTPIETHRRLNAAITAGDPWSGRLLNRHRSGQMYEEILFISPIHDASEKISHFLGLAHVPPEFALDEKPLARTAGSLAHVVNNLLTSSLGNTLLAQRACVPGSAQSAYLRKAEAASLQIAAFLARFLLAAGVVRGNRQAFELRDVLEQTRAGFIERTGREVAVLLPPDTVSLMVCGDLTLLVTLFDELLKNALEAASTPDGIKIIVEVEPASGGVRSGPQARCHVKVQDDGCGMSSEVRRRALEPFFTTGFFGRGLGLAIADSIACAHGGSLSLWAPPGKGTIARVSLPLVDR
ncbi:MAG: PAS domain-containing protein [Bdellovibrionales bacterium]|nr:PAS domain-containing protein [Bdellovibrionales bacterium]